MSLRLRLLQEFLPEVLECWRSSLVVSLLIVAVYILCAAVDDRLLALLELMPRHNLLAERLQELRLFYDRIRLSVVSGHIHRIDVVWRVGGYVYY